MSKSEETFGVSILVIELPRSEKVDFAKKWCSYWRRDPACASAHAGLSEDQVILAHDNTIGVQLINPLRENVRPR